MPDPRSSEAQAPISLSRVFHTWWPLAASWLFMLAEMPLQSAIIARLPNPAINLAAYGGVVLPIAFTIEAPVVMLLAASTSLCKDWASYLKVRRFTMILGATLTTIHALVAFTPLYYLLVNTLINPPPEIVEPARLALMILLPLNWAIGYRRFNQGVLIRFGHSRTVGIGTALRLLVDIAMLAALSLWTELPGAAVAALSVTVGIVVEAAFIGIVVQPVLRDELHWAPPVSPALDAAKFITFFIPLAATEMLGVLVEPALSAAMSRMPDPLNSLAVWPVLYGLIWVLYSGGIAYTEVVIALLDEPQALPALRRFTYILLGTTLTLSVLFAATPLGSFWFGALSGLPSTLVQMARGGMWLALPAPFLMVIIGWLQGRIVHSGATRSITEAVFAFLLVGGGALLAGILWGQASGLYIGMAAITLGETVRAAWLWHRHHHPPSSA
jgi:hypothetical protein